VQQLAVLGGYLVFVINRGAELESQKLAKRLLNGGLS
jgi:hypothetical protein